MRRGRGCAKGRTAQASRAFLGAKDPSADSDPAVREDTRDPKTGGGPGLAQPASRENPDCFPAWEGGILHRFHGEHASSCHFATHLT